MGPVTRSHHDPLADRSPDDLATFLREQRAAYEQLRARDSMWEIHQTWSLRVARTEHQSTPPTLSRSSLAALRHPTGATT